MTRPLRLRLRRLVCSVVDHDWAHNRTVDVCRRCGEVLIHRQL